MGLEFVNQKLKNLLKKNNIEFWVSENREIKCSLAERFIRTFMSKLNRYFTYAKTQNWTSVYQKIINNYNLSIHRSLKTSPLEASTSKNLHQIRKNIYPKSKKIHKSNTYKVNSLVRLSKLRKLFEKGYGPKFTLEIFKISKVIKREQPLYIVQDLSGETIIGKFYKHELTPVTL